MRRLLSFVLGAALLPTLAGCTLMNIIRPESKTTLPSAPTNKPTTKSLVTWLNTNCRKVQSVQASVEIDAKQGRQAIALSGALAARGPRDFRLRGKVLGQPAVDIGSNQDKFWYWIKQANPPHYYFCTYKDLATGKVNVPFPVEVDMVMAALGMSEYDPNGKYELKQTQNTIELIQDTVSASGQPVKRVTVFRSVLVKHGEPQVIEHLLRDAKGNLICRATVQKVEVNTDAVIPSRVTIEWPAQSVSMKLMLSSIEVNKIDRAGGDRMFTLSGTQEYGTFDLARGSVVTLSSQQQASPKKQDR